MSETVREMFADIAPDYDRTNTILSFGVHHLWRRTTVKKSGAKPGDRVLDCASGTGDLAIAFRKVVGPDGSVEGTDFCAPMLELARPKAASRGFEDIRWAVQDVLDLTYQDDQFDLASISFGIRNVDDPKRGLAEMARVVKPGGRVVVLEFGRPRGPFGSVYDWYSTRILPRVGGWVSGHQEAYEYLDKTSGEFPHGEAFLDIMRATEAFSAVNAYPLTGGIAYLYVGEVA